MFQVFYADKIKEFKLYAQARAFAHSLDCRWVLADSAGLVILSSD